MAAYYIVEIDIQDPARFEEYRSKVPATIERYGGKYLVRGGRLETIEGEWKPKRIVVLEFPTLEQAKRWYDSEEYRPLKELRRRTARGHIVLVDGV
jgi:uncharacterized protein (DUF1330 family)